MEFMVKSTSLYKLWSKQDVNTFLNQQSTASWLTAWYEQLQPSIYNWIPSIKATMIM